MADDKSSGVWGSGIVVAGIAAVSALYVAFQHPALVSNRPQEAEYQGHSIVAGQDINARLWQDPFDAVARDVEGGGDRTPLPGNLDLLGTVGDRAIVVTLSGAPYPEVAETRRRLRYAVLAAMHFRRFMPKDEKYIGYFDTSKPPFAPSPDDTGDTDDLLSAGFNRTEVGRVVWRAGVRNVQTACPKALLPKTIPFERFEANTGVAEKSGARVLLLWVDEDFLASAGHPIASLARLRCELANGGYGRFAVLGPQDSTTLATMAREIAEQQPRSTPKGAVTTAVMTREIDGQSGTNSCTSGVPVYNFGATAQESNISHIPLNDLFCKVGLYYQMTVTTDDMLAWTLACELMRRDPSLHVQSRGSRMDLGSPGGESPPGASTNPPPPTKCEAFQSGDNNPPNHIVLISDWDTKYGADLAKTVRHTLEKSIEPTPLPVLVATYLRGLDGRLPNRRDVGRITSSHSGAEAGQNSAEQTGDKPPNVATPENAGQFETAEGQSQYDYLRRLAAELKARDAEFLRKDKSHIAAIGVLGSDVYDKLLILQALRPEFPNANFFTTDLDALLLPDKKSHYTRNLIVASSYGLQLDPSLDCGIPAFRNSYQTSIFVAAARAISHRPPVPECKINAAINGARPEPLLFQIGRTRPQPLPTEPVVSPRTDPPNGFPRVQAADIGIVPISLGTRGAIFAIPLLLIGCVFAAKRVRNDCFTRIGRRNRAWYWRWPGRIAASVVPLAALALWTWVTFGWESAAQWLTQNGLGDPIDPMSVFEGVSIWPTITLRAVAFLLTLFLVWYTLHALEINRQETLGRFGELPEYKGFREEWKYLRHNEKMGWIAAVRACLWFRPLPSAALSQRDDDPRDEKALSEFVTEASSHWLVRFIRAATETALMFGLLWLILRPLSGPPSYIPARGSLAQSIYSWGSLTEFLAALFLTFLVVDATLYSRSFIKWLTFVDTKWNDDTTNQYKRRFQLTLSADLRDWMDLHCLAERTRCIMNWVYFPFLVWAVMLFSRSRLFDDFSMPWQLAVAYVASLCLLIGSVVAYRLIAEKARRVACRQLTDRIIHAKREGREATVGRLETLLTDMQELREGAFAPWASQPLVTAVLLPLLTYGGTTLVHLYALPGI